MVTQDTILHLSEQLSRHYDPERIILFGSYAYGTPGEYSDVDLLVIMPFDGHPFDKSLEMLNLLAAPFSVDLLVRRPDDTARRYREFDPLIREALDRGKVLYDQNS